jgi:hypothetical protein
MASQRTEEQITRQNNATLCLTLQLAVPMWVEKLRGKSDRHLRDIARKSGLVVASSGDILLFRNGEKSSKGKPDKHGIVRYSTADVFNALARGIACAELLTPGAAKQMLQALQGT